MENSAVGIAPADVLKAQSTVDRVRAAIANASPGVKHTIDAMERRPVSEGNVHDVYCLLAQDPSKKTIPSYEDFREAYGLKK